MYIFQVVFSMQLHVHNSNEQYTVTFVNIAMPTLLYMQRPISLTSY